LLRSPAEQELPAAQRARRDELERAVYLLRDKKQKMRVDEYYNELEKLLLELAKLGAENPQSSNPKSQ
jgi:hypothetical protein